MRKGGDNRHVCAGGQRQMMRRLDMRALHHIGAARVDHNQLGPRAQAFFQARCENGVAIGGVCTNHDHNIGMLNGIKVLRARRGAQGLPQTITRGRMAHARASIGVVVLKNRAG